MALSVVLEELDEALTNSSKVAAAFGDELLVYLIDMAILHVRKIAVHTEDDRQRLPEGPSEHAGKPSKRSYKPECARLD